MKSNRRWVCGCAVVAAGIVWSAASSAGGEGKNENAAAPVKEVKASVRSVSEAESLSDSATSVVTWDRPGVLKALANKSSIRNLTIQDLRRAENLKALKSLSNLERLTLSDESSRADPELFKNLAVLKNLRTLTLSFP